MKFFFILLSLITISFVANAKTDTVGELYEQCKIFQNNGFNLKNLDTINAVKSGVCHTRMQTMLNEGQALCAVLRGLKENSKDLLSLEVVAKMRANLGVKSVSQAILIFINFAEKNPKTWNNSYQKYRQEFLSNELPCVI